MFGKAGPFWSPKSEFGRLLEAARIGSMIALGQLLELFRRPLLKTARKSLPTELQAKEEPSDLVQDSLLAAHRHFDQFHGATEAELEAWLRRILRHKFVDRLRCFRKSSKRAMEREISLDDASNAIARHLRDTLLAPDCSPDEALERQEDGVRLHAAMNKLSTQQQQAVELHLFDGLPFEEVGKLLNCSHDAARKTFARAISELATLFGVKLDDLNRPDS